MAYDLSGMAAWSKSNGNVLITDLIVNGQSFTMEGIRTETGIKSTDKFADITLGNTYLQTTNGDPSSISPSGGTTLADIDVSVVEMAIKEKYIKSTLYSKIAQMHLKAGSHPSNPLPYDQIMVDLKGQDVRKKNDILLWQGSTATGVTNVNLNKFNGWLTIALAGASVSGGSAAALAASTAIATVEAIRNVAVTNFPAWLDNTYFMYMSPANFSTLYRATFGLNSVIDNQTLATGKPVTSFYLPGTNCLVLSTNGLQGKNNILVTREYNLILGTDLVSEDDSLEFDYLTEGQYWRLFGVYKLGAQVARVKEVVVTK